MTATDSASASASDEVGQCIRALRTSAGVSLESLAAAIGCSKAHLSLMETGQRTVSLSWAKAIERVLGIDDGHIVSALQWHSVPSQLRDQMRAQVEHAQTRSAELLHGMRKAAETNDLQAFRALVEQASSNVDQPQLLRDLQFRGRGGRGIPVINKVAAGYPADFTDLDYPVSVADEYISCPDVSDPDAFAARVVGDSMAPLYREGDIVIFSPAMPTPSGSDCFVRLERDSQTTFKRVYLEDDGAFIRLQPLNENYAPRMVAREDVGGMYAAVYVMRKVGG